MLANEAQTVLSASATTVLIQVDSVRSGLTANKMDLYFSVGIPNGYTELLSGATFVPKLTQLSTNTISVAGSTIQATVKGVGVDDSITLIDVASSTELCTSATMKSYGVLECVLDPTFDFSAGAIDVGVKENASGTTHSTCENTDTTKCKLELLTI